MKLTDLPDITFSNAGIYTKDEISGFLTITNFMREMKKQTQIDRLIQDQVNGKELTRTQIQLQQQLKEFAMNPIRSCLYQLCSAIVVALILYLICTYTWKYKHLFCIYFAFCKTCKKNNHSGKHVNRDYRPVAPHHSMKLCLPLLRI